MMFWAIAAILTLGSLLVVFAPMIRGSGTAERRASYDMQIYRDQLREVERDVGRGVVTPDEAEATRVEIARKLLAAADAEAREAAAGRAPRRASLFGGGLAAVAAAALTIWLYGALGVPGYPDQPLAERQARQAQGWAARPSQAEAEAILREAEAARPPAEPDPATAEAAALVEQLQAVLADRPDDLQGHRLLARALDGLGRMAEAAEAQERVLAILGEQATADDHARFAEFLIRAAGGYVSPEAEAAIVAALDRDGTNPPARYFQGLALLQGGQPAQTYEIWSALRAEGPAEAPWVRAIEAELDTVAALAGLGAPEAAQPGEPAAQRIPAAAEGMVGSLGARLAREGGPPRDWAQLIRSLGVLGRIEEAAAVWEEARVVFASDDAALAALAEAARDARLLQ